MKDFSNNCCAGIVTYNPNISLLRSCIESIYKQVKIIVLVDNGSNNINNIIELSHIFSNINVIELNDNKGIAYALNVVAIQTKKHKCTWFLTLDQDSECVSNMIAEYSICTNNDKVGIICPCINLRILNKHHQHRDERFTEVDVAITSGCLVRYDTWLKVGGFWEYLFIDKVDDDFCFAVKKSGYKIYKANNIILSHEIGHPMLHRFLWIKYYTDSYPPFRYFYIARNNMIYYKCSGQMTKLIMVITKRFLKIVVGEKNKLQRIKYYLKGCKDGLCWILRYSKRGCPQNRTL